MRGIGRHVFPSRLSYAELHQLVFLSILSVLQWHQRVEAVINIQRKRGLNPSNSIIIPTVPFCNTNTFQNLLAFSVEYNDTFPVDKQTRSNINTLVDVPKHLVCRKVSSINETDSQLNVTCLNVLSINDKTLIISGYVILV